MQDCVSDLFGEAALLFKDKINFKMPGGSGFTPHQDAQAGWDDYAHYYVTALVSIDEATIENGCLELAAGWHDKGLIGELWKPLSDDDMRGMTFEPLPTRPGDVVFFDSYAPHRSGPNLTAAPRRVLYVTYNRASAGDHRARYYADKRKSFPPDCEREPGRTYVFKV
jgi:ectoine hydroxylase-related dioxygenase (phytanoyl-CoA dioxygenase family)